MINSWNLKVGTFFRKYIQLRHPCILLSFYSLTALKLPYLTVRLNSLTADSICGSIFVVMYMEKTRKGHVRDRRSIDYVVLF